MTRDERIEEMAKILKTEQAKDAFRRATALFPDYSIFGRPEPSAWDEPCAILEKDGVIIEFYGFSRSPTDSQST